MLEEFSQAGDSLIDFISHGLSPRGFPIDANAELYFKLLPGSDSFAALATASDGRLLNSSATKHYV